VAVVLLVRAAEDNQVSISEPIFSGREATISGMKSPFRLDDRMALITGGSSGIGAVYLASGESGFMNGALLPIDGGWTAGEPISRGIARGIIERT
jgi:hypothetical protein